MSEENSRKVYVRPDDTAVIACHNCGLQKNLPVGSYKESKTKKLKIKCVCKNVFTVVLEFRKYFRKDTNLFGAFINHSQKNKRSPIIVKNLSMVGVGFVPREKNKFTIGDEITVLFRLDDTERTMIKRKAIVRSIHEDYVGCEIEKTSKYLRDGDFAVYLMS